MTRLPHVGRLLVSSPEEAMENVDIVVVSSSEPSVVDVLLSSPPPRIIDINGRLGTEVEELPGYEGIGW